MASGPKSYHQIVYPSTAIYQKMHNLVVGAIPFPANGKSGILIHGPNGTGKTTLAELLPEAMEQVRSGNSPSVSFLPVKTGNNGPALVQQADNIASTMPLHGRFQYIIFDEVDNLGAAAMTSLKLVMNPPSAIFILTTNNLDKIDLGVRSRSHMIPMTVPPPNAWLLRCHAVLQNHGIQKMPSDDTLLPIIASCGGDARNIMDQMDALALEMQAAGVK